MFGSSFSSLRQMGEKLAEGAREFEAALQQPLVSTGSSASSSGQQRQQSPASREGTPVSPTSSLRNSVLGTFAAGATSSPRSSIDVGGSRSVSGGSGSPAVDTAVQSASQLADSAMSSLRMSLRKGRASLDSVNKARASGELPRAGSTESLSARVASPPPATPPAVTPPPPPPPPPPLVEEPETTENLLIDVADPPKEEEKPASIPEPVTLIPAASSPAPAPAPAPAPSIVLPKPDPINPLATSTLLPTSPPASTPRPNPLLRSASPDERFTIATAEATPDGPSRAPTPAVVASIDESLPSEGESKVIATVSVPPVEEAVQEDVVKEELLDQPIDQVKTELEVVQPLKEEEKVEESIVEEEEAVAVKEEPVEESIVEPIVEEGIPEPPAPSSIPAVVEETVPLSTTKSISSPPSDLQKSYDNLLKLKQSLDRVIQAHTSLSNVEDPEALENELKTFSGKSTLSVAETGRLSAQLAQQKERMEELRDTHRLEAKSQTEQVDILQAQLSQKEKALKNANDQLSKTKDELSASKETIVKMTEEHEKLKLVAKEEEEKRVKALSLLRALRQKLVKAEKDKEDAEKERDASKAGENSLGDAVKADRARYDQEIVSMRAAQEQQLTKMRAGFDREINSIRAQSEREAQARKGQFELDAITVKAVHAKEVHGKDSRIAQLENTVKELTAGRDSVFDQLQLRTAEIESSSAHQESLQGKTAELQYELKEAQDRAAALQEEVDELRKSRRDVTRDDGNTRRLLLEAETRHETRIREMEAKARQLERDRKESEEEMGKNLQDRLREVERMRQQIAQKDIDYAESVHSSQQRDAKIEEAEKEKKSLLAKLAALETVLADVKEDAARFAKAEAAVREELSDRQQRATELEKRLEEVQSKESSLRSNNKTLRDELRKLQSGVLQSEKQRHPGVGYFSAYGQSSSSLPMSSGASDGTQTPSRNDSSTTLSGSMSPTGANGSGPPVARANGDEALNFEYLRNVILQFLERPEMRPHLVSVLGVILHFTPAESRRLAAKAT